MFYMGGGHWDITGLLYVHDNLIKIRVAYSKRCTVAVETVNMTTCFLTNDLLKDIDHIIIS